MNKSELVKALADKEGISIEEALLVVDSFWNGVKDTLSQNGRVEIRGLGSFTLKKYSGYSGRNPRTGIDVHVGPKRLAAFRVSKELKKAINEQ